MSREIALIAAIGLGILIYFSIVGVSSCSTVTRFGSFNETESTVNTCSRVTPGDSLAVIVGAVGVLAMLPDLVRILPPIKISAVGVEVDTRGPQER